MSALPLPTLHELHERFSEARIEIAARYAEKLGMRDTARLWCMKHHLEVTSSSRYWCIAFTAESDGKQRVLARLGDRLQRFDGTSISALNLSPEQEVAAELFRSNCDEHMGLALFQPAADTLPLVTSYCKAAREHAYAMACADAFPQQPELRCSNDERADKALRQMIAIRVKFHVKNLGATLREFCTHIDPKILRAIRSVGCPTAVMYNWLVTGERNRRLQALAAQRILVPVLVHHQTSAQILSTIVDLGLPLNDELAKVLNSKPAFVRALGKASPYHAGTALFHVNREGKHEGWNALLAGASLGNRMPRKRPEWKVFIALWSAIPYMALNRVNLTTLLRGTPTNWSDPAWDQITATIQHAGELFKHVNYVDDNNRLVDRRGIATRNLLTFIEGCTYSQLANLMKRFDQALDAGNIAYHEKYRDRQALTHWPGLLTSARSIMAPNGCEIVELLSAEDLYAEHRALGHCIDTYDRFALRGTCRLLSVRQAGVSVASVEIVQRDGLPRLAQLQAHKNRSVASDSPASVAVVWLMTHLRDQSIPHNLNWPNLVPANYEQFMSESMVAWIKTSVGQP